MKTHNGNAEWIFERTRYTTRCIATIRLCNISDCCVNFAHLLTAKRNTQPTRNAWQRPAIARQAVPTITVRNP